MNHNVITSISGGCISPGETLRIRNWDGRGGALEVKAGGNLRTSDESSPVAMSASCRLVSAPRGPRFLSDGSYAQPYRFSPLFSMASDGTVRMAVKEVAAHA